MNSGKIGAGRDGTRKSKVLQEVLADLKKLHLNAGTSDSNLVIKGLEVAPKLPVALRNHPVDDDDDIGNYDDDNVIDDCNDEPPRHFCTSKDSVGDPQVLRQCRQRRTLNRSQRQRR